MADCASACVANRIVAAISEIPNLKYRMKYRSRLGAEVASPQELGVVVGDRGPGFDVRPANRLIERVHAAFNFENLVAVESFHRHEDIRRARRILLDHPRIGLESGVAFVHGLTAQAVADSRGINSAAVQNDRTVAATRRILRSTPRDGRRYEEN